MGSARMLFRSLDREPVLGHQLQIVVARRHEDIDPCEPSGCVPAMHYVRGMHADIARFHVERFIAASMVLGPFKND